MQKMLSSKMSVAGAANVEATIEHTKILPPLQRTERITPHLPASHDVPTARLPPSRRDARATCAMRRAWLRQ